MRLHEYDKRSQQDLLQKLQWYRAIEINLHRYPQQCDLGTNYHLCLSCLNSAFLLILIRRSYSHGITGPNIGDSVLHLCENLHEQTQSQQPDRAEHIRRADVLRRDQSKLRSKRNKYRVELFERLHVFGSHIPRRISTGVLMSAYCASRQVFESWVCQSAE